MLSFKEYVNEIKSRFSDSIENTPEIQEVNQDLVFELNGKKLEFKSKNEVKENGDIYFTWEEALALQKDNWRLPTRKEFKALIETGFVFGHSKGIFDGRLILPAAGYRNCNGNVCIVGSIGYYWSSTPNGSKNAWYLCFNSGEVLVFNFNRCYGLSVRLVREV